MTGRLTIRTATGNNRNRLFSITTELGLLFARCRPHYAFKKGDLVETNANVWTVYPSSDFTPYIGGSGFSITEACDDFRRELAEVSIG